ncbi:MAG: SDR family oxidoreductase [Cyclobacteriaceae bacterium]
MKVLLTGSTGYIGRRLLPVLVGEGHQVVCAVRDRRRFDFDDFSEEFMESVEVLEADFSIEQTLQNLPDDIDVAYYLIHSLNTKHQDFKSEELITARNFAGYISGSACQQVIYLGGIVNDSNLSQHLDSRKSVEDSLRKSGKPVTILRAGIVIGSGSASFEIIRDLIEKLPVMVAPKWLSTRCQPIAIKNIIDYLCGVMLNDKTYDRTFDIGGRDVLTYKQMLLKFAEIRKLKRWIVIVPVLSPRLSSLWLHFVTSTSYYLARNLVDSMKNEVIVQPSDIDELIDLEYKYNYEESIERAFAKINQKQVISSWKDSFANNRFSNLFIDQAEAPDHGCFKDKQVMQFERDPKEVLNNIWSIGGKRGWYYGTILWELRGILDKLVGGVGLRRGRRSDIDIKSGDALDFWRVLYADKEEGRLLLFAEMKLPGEAWLEFKVCKPKGEADNKLIQTATFRPVGIWGRLYWYLVAPFHIFIFKNMAKNIIHYEV